MKKYRLVHYFTTTFQLSTKHLTFDDEFIICTTNDVIYYVSIAALVRVSGSDSYNLKKKKKTKNLEFSVSFKIKKTENIVYSVFKGGGYLSCMVLKLSEGFLFIVRYVTWYPPKAFSGTEAV